MEEFEFITVRKMLDDKKLEIDSNSRKMIDSLLEEVQLLRKDNDILRSSLHVDRGEMRIFESMYRSLYNYTPIPYVTIDLKGEIIDLNDAFCIFTGCQHRASIGESIIEFMDIDSRGRLEFFLDALGDRPTNQNVRDQKLFVNFICKGKKKEVILYYNFYTIKFKTGMRMAILDITDMNDAKKQLKAEHDRYQVALQVFEDYIFEYDRSKDELICYGNPLDASVPKTTVIRKDNYIRWLAVSNVCTKEELTRLFEFVNGERNIIRICMRDPLQRDGYARWFEAFGTCVYESGELKKIVGRISDITEQEKKEEKELEKSYCDGLTGLYNTHRGLYLLNEYLSSPVPHTDFCLIMFEIENLEQINEEYSITFGNAMIGLTAQVIKRFISDTDIAIRIGGNKFLILKKNTNQWDAALLAEQVAVKSAVAYAGELEHIVIGCCVVDDGAWQKGCYPDIIKIIDKMAKSFKDNHQMFPVILEKEEVLQLFYGEPVFCEYDDYEGVSYILSSEFKDITTFAFDLLEQTKHTDSAIKLLLCCICEEYGLKDVRIYETDTVYLTKYLKYFWQKKEDEQEIPKMIHYESKEFYNKLLKTLQSKDLFDNGSDWEKECDPEVIEYLNKQYGDNRILVDLLLVDGRMEGLFVFSNDDNEHIWLKQEKNELHGLTQLMSMYLNKNRSDSANRSKSEFLSKMSHEIRTPLNGVVGMLQLIKNYTLDDGELKQEEYRDKIFDCIDKAQISVNFLLSIINDILDMAKIENGKMELCSNSFSISEILENIKVMFQGEVKRKHIDFSIMGKYKIDNVSGDGLRFSQVIVNLVSNAVKFTPENGKITLELKQTGLQNKRASYHISVRDNGCGIPNESQSDIFKAFVQAGKGKSTVQGTGLGLSISYNIVELMGGQLKLKSILGEGSEFYFNISLPVAEKQAKIEETILEQGDFKGKRLLLAEDNELNAEIMEELLTMEGFMVDKASDGMIAVKKFLNHEDEYYQVILMDIRMPNMDGLEATKQIRMADKKDARRIPIVAVTSDAFDDDIERAVTCGMNGYITKPVDMIKLKKLMYQLL